MSAAKKSRVSKEAVAGRDRYGKRPTQIRPPLPIVALVCDDAKTAIAYFSELKRMVRATLTLELLPKPDDRSQPADIVDAAIQLRNKYESAEARDDDDATCVWVLLDLEGTPTTHSAAHDARKAAQAASVKVALSNPCFEVWTLLHLIDTGQGFLDCRAVLSVVEQEWTKAFGKPMGSKAQADYAKLLPRIQDAIGRAKSRRSSGQSWTEVYLPAEHILSLAGHKTASC